MKMLLTSYGLHNATLVSALADMMPKPFSEAAVIVVLDATVGLSGDKGWFLADFDRLRQLGWQEMDLIDLASVPPEATRDRLHHADVIYVEGGEEQHLARVFLERDDLVELFRKLLEEKVYVGVSAGSMIFSRRFDRRAEKIFSRPADLGYDDNPIVASPPFGLFDWFIKPHLHGVYFPEQDDAWADGIAALADFPVYFLDDDSAIRVQGEAGREVTDVVSEGQWRLHDGRTL